MKKLLTFFCLFVLFIGMQTATAKVWRVSNRSLDTDPDYTSLSAAISAASAGDTLYVMGSPTSYGDITLDKKLTIIGPGYWLDVNDTTQAYQKPATIGRLNFNSGSEGSVVVGMSVVTTYGGNVVQINTGNITLKKNYIKNNQSGYGGGIYINATQDSIFIQQNWIESDGSVIIISKGSTIRICNNFIKSRNVNGNGLYNYVFNTNDIICTNNVIWGLVNTWNCYHINNILVDGTLNINTGNIFYNNIGSGTQYPAGNGNQQNVDMSTVFKDYTGTVDSSFMLEAGSPAIGAGVGGDDCGVFGYKTTGIPYVLSGLPGIPAVFNADIPAVGASSLSVTVDAISHNTGK